MTRSTPKIWHWWGLGAACLSACLHFPFANAEGQQSELTVHPSLIERRASITHESYILGPGDGLEIELVDIPQLSGRFPIGPDGTLYLPRLRALYVEGLTVSELQEVLTEQYRTYVIDPQVYVRPISYRPIRVYVGGEVRRPGYYTLSDMIQLGTKQKPILNQTKDNEPLNDLDLPIFPSKDNFSVFPTIFDAVRSAQGITPYSNLSEVQVTRRQPISQGGGRVQTRLNFLSLITEGDESQNIRLLDGDVVNVGKSSTVLLDQLIQAGQTNLTPEFMQVYVTGRVLKAGTVTLPQGSTLVHAIDLAGGTKVLHGKVEFIRFTRAGGMDRRLFGLNSDVPSGDYRNPVLGM